MKARDTKKFDKEGRPVWRARGRLRLDGGEITQPEGVGPTASQAERDFNRRCDKILRDERNRTQKLAAKSLGDVAQDWLVELPKDATLALRTRQGYASDVRNHLLGTDLAAMRPADIRALPDVEGWLNDLIDHKGGPSVQRRCWACLRKIMTRAVREGLVENIAEVRNADPRRQSTTRIRPTVVRNHVKRLNEDQIASLMKVAYAKPSAVEELLPELITLMLGTGTRIGEALALRWEDIDFSGSEVWATVSGTVIRTEPQDDSDGGPRIPGHIIRQPKTKHEDENKNRRQQPRRVMVHKDAAEMLEKLRANARGFSEPIFPASAKSATVWRNPSNTATRIHKLLKEAGVGWAVPHTFRRTFVNRMALVPGVTIAMIAKMVGHTKPSMTTDEYLDPDVIEVLDVVKKAQGY